MGLRHPEGATPLDADAARGLIPSLSTQGELNEFEARNIAEALRWAKGSRILRSHLLTTRGLRQLHLRMFDRTWEWAGRFRNTDTNIGYPWPQVPEAVKNLCDDVAYQVAEGEADWDNVAIRLHHRLVSIHPFPNGNGRHARIATDLFLRTHDQEPFTWGSEPPTRSEADRQEYLAALREADGGAFGRLRAFVRGDRYPGESHADAP